MNTLTLNTITRLIQSHQKPFLSSYKKNRIPLCLFFSASLITLPSLHVHAATFPPPGTDAIYNTAGDNIDATVPGTSKLILNAGQNTTLAIDGITLQILNFNNLGGGAIRVNDGGMLTIQSIDGGVANFNMNTSTSAGAISNAGTALINNSIFNDNHATNGSGGAISNAGFNALAIINNSTFSNNTATNGSGGAIFNGGSTAIINNSSFNNNSTTGSGGAIFNNTGILTITDSSFTNNDASFGGAIASLNGTVNLNTTTGNTSLFNGNTDNSGRNSITFFGVGLTTLNIDNQNNALLDMRDPIREALSPTHSTHITQTGSGVWALGGDSNFTSALEVDFTINGGRLYLYNTDGSLGVTDGTIALPGTGSFTLGMGASLVAGGNNTISAQTSTVTFENGSIIRGGSSSQALGGGSGLFENGGSTHLTITADNGVALNGQVTLAALDVGDTFGLDAVLGDGIGVGSILKNGNGVVVLEGVNTYTGGTGIQGGVLSVSQDANLGNALGNLSMNGGALRNTLSFSSSRNVNLGAGGGIFDTQADLILNGTISGNGLLTKIGGSTLVLNGINTYTAETYIADGTLSLGPTGSIASSSGVSLIGSSAVLDIGLLSAQTIQDLSGVAGSVVDVLGSLAFGTENSTVFQGMFQQNGNLVKQGIGEVALTGDSSAFAGHTTIQEGTLRVNGQLGGSLRVSSNGRLMGTGSVGSLQVDGTIAPGNSIGTLSINGNYSQSTGSIYEVEINAQGNSDLIAVTGSALINGGTVLVIQEPGTYTPGLRYTILSAAGGLSGTYDALLPPPTLFLAYLLDYDSNNVYLILSRLASAFADFATTLNQAAVANAAQSLGLGNPVYNAILNLTSASQAQQAFNALSGEAHASILGSWIEDSRYVRNATLNRLTQAFMPQVTAEKDKFGNPVVLTPGGTALWGQAFGSWGHIESDGNAAQVSRNIGGLFIGADREFGPVRLGVLGGYSRSKVDIDHRASDARSDDYSLGVYAGKQFHPWVAKAGAVYTWHQLDMTRDVSFPGFFNNLRSDVNGHTAQGFAELGYQTHFRQMNLEPFVGIAYVDVDSGAWRETGGAAALRGDNSANMFYSSLGARQAMLLSFIDVAAIHERAMLAWRHAYDDTAIKSTFNFVSGGIPFVIQGAPIAKDSFVLDVGLDTDIPRKNLNFRLAYMGQFAREVEDNGVSGTLSWIGD
ncbi:hypothetical protein FOLKNPGA_03363 [Legionella sp. PC1000]|uniref:autotransporter outer membrane beta-barrel domain-containing protein n=1 Tax=Legionella sp. PC1000 TaxID=2746060 RepID=UPI0015F7F27D|nr:autotransporter domain-containing protein [Legionella sp. PC1000]QLZ70549.1 hypothetical protein FOLKNPGA_03363 [Legionella sp. PC1000]